MSGRLDPPPGFGVVRSGGTTLLAAADVLDELIALGLTRPEAWEELLLAGPQSRAGRGATAILALGGSRARLKQLRRGGWAGWIWRERFLGTRRAMTNLRLPIEAARRNVATARPLALLLVEGPPGMFRAWLATEEIAGAADLGLHFASSDPPGAADLGRVMAALRQAHDVGLDHRDLNVGNILLRRAAVHGSPQVFLVDLDGARIAPAPLSFRRRARALFRLERSYVKRIGGRQAQRERDRRLFYELYACGDPAFERRVGSLRRMGRFRSFLHRWGGLR